MTPFAGLSELVPVGAAMKHQTYYNASCPASNCIDRETHVHWARCSKWGRAEYNLDEEKSTFCETGVPFMFEPWLEIDLGQVAAVSSVGLKSRTDCCWHRLGIYEIWVSSTAGSPQSGTKCYSGQVGASWETAAWMHVPCSATGQYVSVLLPGPGNRTLTLAEFYAFGSAPPAPPFPPPIAPLAALPKLPRVNAAISSIWGSCKATSCIAACIGAGMVPTKK